MEIIARNVKLRFEYARYIEFTELFKDVTEIGGGYSDPTGTASVSNNIIITSKKQTSVKFQFITGHKYLVSVKTDALNMWISTANSTNHNGVDLLGPNFKRDGTPMIYTDNPDDTKNFSTFPYLCMKFPAAPTDAVIEIYIYDITGYEDEKFANITYNDMKSGTIKIVDTNTNE